MRSTRKHLLYQRIYILSAHLYFIATIAPNAGPLFLSTGRHLYILDKNTRLEAEVDFLANTSISRTCETSGTLKFLIKRYFKLLIYFLGRSQYFLDN